MRILFLARHYTYFRNFEAVLRQLAQRGHLLHLVVERGDTLGGVAMVEALAAEFPSITYGEGTVASRRRVVMGRPASSTGS
jgi:hypothetical protein